MAFQVMLFFWKNTKKDNEQHGSYQSRRRDPTCPFPAHWHMNTQTQHPRLRLVAGWLLSKIFSAPYPDFRSPVWQRQNEIL